jgi:isopentenyl phosphate kinase
MDPDKSQSPFLVLKIGGSLFSRKGHKRRVNQRAISAYARLIADLALAAPGRLALISGGGSFGHPVAKSLDPSDPFGALPLTEANFALKWIWTVALRKEKVLAVPFQLMSICAFNLEGLVFQSEVLRLAMEAGILPVLSGDCLIGPSGTLTILPSDKVPEIFVSMFSDPVRVVTLTDVPGIVKGGPRGSQTYRYIHPDAREAVYQDIWEGSAWDATRSMGGKLDALIEFARRDAECFILKGNMNLPSLRFLLESVDKWSSEILYTRIALADSPQVTNQEDRVSTASNIG